MGWSVYVQYMDNYLKNGRCSISNNAAERAVKSYVMGRKNFLFHDTVKGATTSAIVYALAETAKVNGLNIRLYLETVMTKMLDYKNESQSIIEDFMSWSEMIQETCNLNKHSEIRFTMDWMRRIFIRQFTQRLLKKSKTFVSDFISPSIYL